jgi:hypothetical protein
MPALKKDEERCYRLILRPFVFLDRELERKAEMEPGVQANEESEKRMAAFPGKRFHVVPLCEINAHFVTIDSAALYGIMREISPKFDVSREEFSKMTSRGANFRAL